MARCTQLLPWLLRAVVRQRFPGATACTPARPPRLVSGTGMMSSKQQPVPAGRSLLDVRAPANYLANLTRRQARRPALHACARVCPDGRRRSPSSEHVFFGQTVLRKLRSAECLAGPRQQVLGIASQISQASRRSPNPCERVIARWPRLPQMGMWVAGGVGAWLNGEDACKPRLRRGWRADLKEGRKKESNPRNTPQSPSQSDSS